MNFVKNIFLTLLLFLVVFSAFSQEKEIRREARELRKVVEDLHFQNKFRESLRFMVRLDSIDEEVDLDRKYMIARIYIGLTSTKLKGKKYLEAYLNGNKKFDWEAHYYLGKIRHLENRFDEAISNFEKYLANAKKSDERIPEIKRAIQCCVNGKDLVANPVDVKIENIGKVINTVWPDFVPVISADESVLYFTSRRPGSVGGLMNIGGESDTLSGEYFEDIYVSVNLNGSWTKPVSVGRSINTTAHDACIALSADGQKLFVYRSDSVKWGNIFLCELNGFEWSKPVWMEMGKIDTKDWWEGSCSLSGDENVLYFSSNKPSGLGGRDLYSIRKLPDGKWANAQNLGPGINTALDDDAPFIHPDGRTLYFSSQGHNSMGGYDIFRTIMQDDGSFSRPENIGYPINTADDDIYFVLSASGERGYYSSFRLDGYGEKDIYVIHFPKAKEEVREVAKPLTLLKGIIKSCKTTNQIIAKITVMDNETQTKIGDYKPNTATGKFLILVPPGKNYSVTIESQGHLFYSENVFIPDQKEFVEIVRDIQLECVEVGSKIVLRNIFYDFDKATLRPESKTELEKLYKLLSENPKLVVEISGHTDAKGSDEYNIKLSQNRAQSVVEYLVKAGIPPQRMIAKGYGERQPIALNVNLDGSDNPEGRQLNRRTEMRILGIEGENIEVEKIQVPDALKIRDISEVVQAEAGTIIFKLQLAASKSPIPNEYFLGFNDVVAEKGSDGITRYTSGSFTDAKAAEKYRQEIVEKKIIANPFIVAFKDGLRLSIDDTKKLLDGVGK